MNKWVRRLGQAALYALFALTLAVFSRWPVYQHLPPDQALFKLSFSHQGQRLGECEELSPAELAKLPPNMRAPTRCPRERSPLRVQVEIDGAVVHNQVAKPSGLSADGASAVYQRMPVSAGRHRVVVRLNDNANQPGYNFELHREVELQPAQIMVIDFDSEQQRITLR